MSGGGGGGANVGIPNYPCHVANIMTFSGEGGGGGKAPMNWLTFCKLKVDQKKSSN